MNDIKKKETKRTSVADSTTDSKSASSSAAAIKLLLGFGASAGVGAMIAQPSSNAIDEARFTSEETVADESTGSKWIDTSLITVCDSTVSEAGSGCTNSGDGDRVSMEERGSGTEGCVSDKADDAAVAGRRCEKCL